MVLNLTLRTFLFLDPNCFVARNLMSCADQWEHMGCPDQVLEWVKNGVNVHSMFKHLKGHFKGKSYDSNSPPEAYFTNSRSCIGYEKFISDTWEDRIANGSMSLIGRVGECGPHCLVLPITIEPCAMLNDI